jgi:protein-tyrosine phosphatase
MTDELDRFPQPRRFEPTGRPLIKTVLFLCTGNYYRSRFAEELFNHRGANAGIRWQARSRALAVELGARNVGPLSPFALNGLRARGWSAKGGSRMPRQCVAIDLENAHRIIALNEPEHRPLVRTRFPEWESRIQFWDVEDVEQVRPEIALAAIDKKVDALLAALGGTAI